MYAVIRTGGKQYRVSEGDQLDVELLSAEPGEEIALEDVLMLGDAENTTIGTPLVEGASVTVRVVAHDRGPKIRIIKFKRRKHHRKHIGHRQHFTRIEVTGINPAA